MVHLRLADIGRKSRAWAIGASSDRFATAVTVIATVYVVNNFIAPRDVLTH